ncbi:TRAP dicarboxylate transporter, DctM subunit [Trichormus variabilis ATCC 29413]|uniref:TRAP dicarboxylate transporter, DctM subunit n=2 Tax=Anabaena variabilis TaxID=264691 RepID=Q3MES8_TRIV2|nr:MULTISPECIES: TRAP transporter large permease subunit [Nostocaceae]ABA20508.1 TRAP dicarboxylate transporter, DctM subunit [Trichormus variabilis ATCC 29413]MBC1214675.1 TRAP transporter large permease subunit [Trichormus variabilis ARAD]MBC1257675.1 TRAP transporter large permease subunit [Trichormus variabilis V5]MBC1267007.1 TRAP transporter large permease subunit [Trichormus variabilis FSR]MBC1300847.1 TRAP transporter large permease subunit [Trichormus variabilis N2B]
MTLAYEWLGPVMFAGALVLLSSGYPVAFALGGVAILFGLLGIGLGVFDPIFLTAMPQRIFGIMANYTLLAIPYFIFMGAMLEKSGIAERLLETMGILLGRLRGGLALAVVLVGALLAATTGVVAATVVAMGLISLPIMLRYGYNKELATGVIAASGTLGQIIPPSVVLVVLGDQLGVSVGDLFIGSVIPGLMMASAFALHVLIVAFIRPDVAPALPAEVREIGGKALGKRVIQVMIPPLILILLVLGSIFFGFATPTEAGAVGCAGAIALAAANGQFTLESLRQVCDTTLRITSMVVFILIGSTAFSLVFRGLNGDQFMFDVLANLPGGKIGFLFVSMTVVFLLGFFIDFFEIAFIVIPLFVPVAQKLGIDLVWYGVVLGANLQTSFLTPPFGFALFYLRGVAPPEVTTSDIYRGVIPFILLQLLVLLLIIIFPGIVSFLPSLGS